MKWKKKGLIFNVSNEYPWQNQFAMLPTPIIVDDRLRVFLGFCDKDNVGRIGYVDVNPDNPTEIIEVSRKPVLDIGRRGCFDDNGVVPISILKKDNKIFLYYIGCEELFSLLLCKFLIL